MPIILVEPVNKQAMAFNDSLSNYRLWLGNIHNMSTVLAKPNFTFMFGELTGASVAH
jgi:hypothetical protein